jgi:chromosome segregation ATPase
MTRPPLPTLQDLRAEADRLGIRWQPYGVCRRKLDAAIEAELTRRAEQDEREEYQELLLEAKATIQEAKIAKRKDVEREEAIGQWLRIVHGVEADEGAPEVADKIARMGEQIETLRESEAAKDRQIEDLRELEVVKDRRIEALGQVVRGGERQLSELKAQIAGQEGQLRELVSEMFHLEHARDVARKHAQERGRAMYSGPRKQLDRLGEVERRLDRIEDGDTAAGHEFRAAGSAVRRMLDRRDNGK